MKRAILYSILEALDFERANLEHKRLFPDRMGPDMRKALEDRVFANHNTRFELTREFPAEVHDFDAANRALAFGGSK
jgi:hypothetical protein